MDHVLSNLIVWIKEEAPRSYDEEIGIEVLDGLGIGVGVDVYEYSISTSTSGVESVVFSIFLYYSSIMYSTSIPRVFVEDDGQTKYLL